jgi:hypothetical protein
MRITNEPGSSGPSGPFAEMFKLQADFQARLAEETLRYLRRLQGVVVPSAPGTVVMPGQAMQLSAAAPPGGQAELSVEVENLQRVHCMVTPQLTPLVSATGVTWFPALESASASRLIAPGAVEKILLNLQVPAQLPDGEYRGALLLQGFRHNSLPVLATIGIAPPAPTNQPEARATKNRRRRKATARKSRKPS